MKFSTKTTYGLRAMIKLAKHYDLGNIPLSNIARVENISQKYLERIFAKLKKSGLVKSVKGVNGGYELSKKPAQINVYEIIKALEDRISPFYCLSDSGVVKCKSKNRCGVVFVLKQVQKAVNTTLKNIKLSDL